MKVIVMVEIMSLESRTVRSSKDQVSDAKTGFVNAGSILGPEIVGWKGVRYLFQEEKKDLRKRMRTETKKETKSQRTRTTQIAKNKNEQQTRKN